MQAKACVGLVAISLIHRYFSNAGTGIPIEYVVVNLRCKRSPVLRGAGVLGHVDTFITRTLRIWGQVRYWRIA